MVRPTLSLTRAAAALAALSLACSHRPLHAANFFWKQAAATNSWSSGNNWSAVSPLGIDNAGVPNNASTVNITLADGANHTITYDYTGPAVTVNLLQVNLNGNPANTTTLNMTANALTVATALIGYSGAGGSNGSATISQSGGLLTVAATNTGFFLGFNATDKGVYNLSGSAVFVTNNVQIIGYGGTGTLNQSGGTNTTNIGFNTLYLGYLANSHGTYNLSAGTVTSFNPVYVGYSGDGTFNQTGGSTILTGQTLSIGQNANSTGAYVLSGAASLIAATEYVGYANGATGIFHQLGGINTINTSLHIGELAGSVGAYTLSGTGSLTVHGEEWVGASGIGTFGQTGGIHTTDFLYLGKNVGSGGSSYNLSGGTLAVGPETFIGYNAPADFTHTAGSANLDGALILGYGTNATGTYTLGGTGSLTVTGSENIGNSSAGQFNQSGGANTMRALYIGLAPTALTNTYGLSGGTLSAVFDAAFPDSAIEYVGFSGLAVFNQTGGINSARYLYVGYGSIGTNSYTQSGGIVSLFNTLYIGNANSTGVYNFTGGTINTQNVIVGQASGSGFGTFNISGGATLITDTLLVQLKGKLNLSDGGIVSTSSLFLNAVPSRFNWSGGTLIIGTSTVVGPGTDFPSLILNGTHSLVLPRSTLYVNGDPSGAGVLTQDGTSSVIVGSESPGNIVIAINSNGNGIYTIQNAAASLILTGNLYIGGGPSQVGGYGTFNLYTGSATISNLLKIWPGAGLLNFFSGSLSVGLLDYTGASDRFVWSAGTLKLLDGALFGSDSLTIPALGTLSGSGIIFPRLVLNGKLSLTNAFDSLSVHGTIAGPGTVTLAPTTTLTSDGIRATSLTIAGLVRIRSNGTNTGTSKVNSLTLSGTANNWSGKIDLTNNALIVQSVSPAEKLARIPTLQNQILTAKANGAWTGNGITSSTIPTTPNTSLALADNADLHLTTFKGQTVDDNCLIITIARLGNANLDNKVDAFDLNLLASHWQQPTNALWSAGDFTNDGKVDAFDLNLLAANWQFGTPLASSFYPLTFDLLTSPSPIPEPSSLMLLFPTLALLRRKLPRQA